MGRDEIKWQELLSHFRSVQAKHEKARRQAIGNDGSPVLGALPDEKFADTTEKPGRGTVNRPPMRRRVTGDVSLPPSLAPNSAARTGALSPLNPQRKPPGALSNLMSPPATTAAMPSNLNPAIIGLTPAQKQRRSIDLTKKT